MIVRFDTWERAALFAAEMRAEGRHAVLLDGCVSFLWGPLAMGGVRVAVSDIVLEDDGEWPAVDEPESEFLDVLRRLVATVAIGGSMLGIAMAMLESAHHPERRSTDPVALLTTVLAIAGSAAAFAVMGAMMPSFTRFLRDDTRLTSRLVRIVVVLLFLV